MKTKRNSGIPKVPGPDPRGLVWAESALPHRNIIKPVENTRQQRQDPWITEPSSPARLQRVWKIYYGNLKAPWESRRHRRDKTGQSDRHSRYCPVTTSIQIVKNFTEFVGLLNSLVLLSFTEITKQHLMSLLNVLSALSWQWQCDITEKNLMRLIFNKTP